MAKGNAFIIGFVALVLAAHSIHGNSAPASYTNSGRTMRFFIGSVTECTDPYARSGLCKKTPLTRCILIDSGYDEDLVCKVVAKASLRSSTGFTRLYTDVRTFDVPRRAKKFVRCFDYNFLESPDWDFLQFESFNGHCQKGTAAAPPRWACEPETTGCTFFEYDQESCLPGWPCLKLHVDSKSLVKTKCTPELVAREVCTEGDPDVFACLQMTNGGIAPLRCDVRFNVERVSDRTNQFALLRNHLLYAGGIDEVCFRFQGIRDVDEVRAMPVNAVCRSQRDYTGDLHKICDLNEGPCEAESKVVVYD
ncbi:hypothetical protein KEG38_50375 [Polyangium jinanense]|uniref:hypothetical protein n=1 Tax=Polyangium jinanense TaxID=2829994 RepID=UPI0023421854|nr:hypothetical protein [Polyangium jinanense]MDC3962126.1 hypothetical protein [Polyangium jinanense]